MKVAFIVHDLYQDDNRFPLGPGYLAAVLEREGFGVDIYSQDIFHTPDNEVAQLISKKDYGFIGIGFLAARFRETVLGLCHTVNRVKKDAWLILGGQGPSPIPDYMLDVTGADIVTLGEAEKAILDLAYAKQDKDDIGNIKGIAYKQNGEFFRTSRNKPVRNLDVLPYPSRNLFPMNKYIENMNLYRKGPNDRVIEMISTRGCTGNCTFCYRQEKGLRVRKVVDTVDEMEFLLKKYKTNYFLMHDELFTVPAKRLYEFRDELDGRGMDVKLSVNARVDTLDDEIAKCLAEMGCQFLNIGFESADQKVLDLMNKRVTVAQNIEAVKIAKRHGIGVGLNFIWGNLGDTAESLQKIVDFLLKYNTYDQVRTIRPVTPYPGCYLYYKAIQDGSLKGPGDFFDKFKNSDLYMVNFTDIPNDRFYKLLFEANKTLILDQFNHTNGSMEAANNMIQNFYNLYFKGFTKFRGARSYERKK